MQQVVLHLRHGVQQVVLLEDFFLGVSVEA
jgi:hypothetical protein